MKNLKEINSIINGLIVILLIGCFSINVSAQNDKASRWILNANGSIFPVDLTEIPLAGIHLGLNVYRPKTTKLGFEGQLSGLFGDYGRRNTDDAEGLIFLTYFNLMGGMRYYLNNPEKTKFPIYTNMMLGVSHVERIETIEGTPFSTSSSMFSWSVGTGVYVAMFNRATLGVSIEIVDKSVFVLPRLGINLFGKTVKQKEKIAFTF